MKIVFFGSSGFALPALAALEQAGQKIVLVVTQPDRKKGRGLNFAETRIKAFAKKAALKIFQPEKINTPESVKLLKGVNPELFVVIAYGQILSPEVLGIPAFFPLNAHASLLPRYRGAAPVNWAIIRGEKSTGVSIIKMTRSMDAGPILLQREAEIHDSDTAQILETRLADLAARALLEALSCVEKNTCSFIPQDRSLVSLAPKLTKDDGRINWHSQAGEIHNLIRGCLDWPGAFTYYHGKIIKVYKSRIADPGIGQVPGEITAIAKNGITVSAAGGSITIEELQIEGKRRMSAAEFLAGHRISPGEILRGNR